MSTLNERIKKLRKILDLTQQDFADRLGTTRNNIAGYEIGRRAPSIAVISLICREFNVNETWLRTGSGDMFVPKEEDPLDELVKQKNLSRWDRLLIEKFLDLNAGQREAVMKYVLKVVDNYRQLEAQVPAQKSKEKETSIESDSIESEETLYKSSSGYVASADSSALSSTGGMEKTDGAKLA